MDGFAQERFQVETAFLSAWVQTCPVAIENAPFTVPTGAPWVRLSIRNGPAFVRTLGVPGANQERHVAVVFLQIFSPQGTGTNAARQFADQFAAIFGQKEVPLSEGGVLRFQATRLEPGFVDGAFYNLTASVAYWRDD